MIPRQIAKLESFIISGPPIREGVIIWKNAECRMPNNVWSVVDHVKHDDILCETCSIWFACGKFYSDLLVVSFTLVCFGQHFIIWHSSFSVLQTTPAALNHFLSLSLLTYLT